MHTLDISGPMLTASDLKTVETRNIGEDRLEEQDVALILWNS